MGLPVHTLQPDDRVRILPRLLFLLLACIAGLWISTGRFYTVESESLSSMERICPQQPEYDPTEALQKLSIRPPSVLHSVKLLSEAVQLSTEAMDEILSDDEELESVTRNATFSPFSDWIEKVFSLHSCSRLTCETRVCEQARSLIHVGRHRSLAQTCGSHGASRHGTS